MLRYYADLDDELSATAVRYPFLMSERALHRSRHHGRHHAGRLHGNPDEGFSYLFLSDAASLVVAILEKQPPGYPPVPSFIANLRRTHSLPQSLCIFRARASSHRLP